MSTTKELIQSLESGNRPSNNNTDDLIASLETGGIKQPKKTEQRPMSLGQTIADIGLGTLETAGTMATGTIGGLAGLAGGIVTTAIKGDEEGRKFREFVSDYYTYKPTTKSGRESVRTLGTVLSPLAWPGKFLRGKGGEQWGNVGDVAMMAGMSKLPAAVSWGGRTAKSLGSAAKTVFSSKEKIAAGMLKKEMFEGEPFISNVDKARKIQEAIQKESPEFQLTYGQMSDYPPQIRSEAVTARSSKVGSVLFKKLEAGNQQALREYLKTKFKGSENIDDVINTIKPKLEKLSSEGKLTQNSVDNIIADLPDYTMEGIQKRGGILRTALKEAKTKAWEKSQQLYQSIDDIPVKPEGLLEELKKLESTSISRGESSSAFPSHIISQLEENMITKNIRNPAYTQGGDIPLFTQSSQSNFNQLRGLRGQAYKIANQTDDAQIANNARNIGNIIDKAMEAEAKRMGGDTWANFRTAQDYYNKEYIGKYRLGTVGKVLKGGKDAQSRYHLTDSEVIAEFFNRTKRGIEPMQDLVNAIGYEKSQALTRDYAIYHFKDKVLDKSTGQVIPDKLSGWYSKYKDILRATGMDKEFSNINNAQKMADIAKLKATEYEKSIVGKMLGVNPDEAIKTAFSGKAGRNSGLVADELIKEFGGNERALNGIRNSFRDFLLSEIEKTQKDISGGRMLSAAAADKTITTYMPAIEKLWAKEPNKINALKNFQEAVEIINRNKASQFAGPQTAEFEKAMKTAEKLPFMGYQGVVLRFAVRLYEILHHEKVQRVLDVARFDPQYADYLMRKARLYEKTKDINIIKNIITPDMIKVGAISGVELSRPQKTRNEKAFRKWYGDYASKLGLNPNPDDPRHYYDYRSAYLAGAKPDLSGHWPSKFKLKGHPNLFIEGNDTREE